MTGTSVATTSPKPLLMAIMAERYNLTEVDFSRTVRATCGLQNATPEQFAAFCMVANEYKLNPLTKEIYAFPAKGGGVVPIVSIDGWVNLVNSHPQCDGFEFEVEHKDGKLFAISCRMHRKDRKHPVTVTEYLSECKRSTEPWKMENRMLRHKAMIQAARYAFGFAGIYDEDEGRVIAEVDAPKVSVPSPPPAPPPAPAIEDKSSKPAQVEDATIVAEDEMPERAAPAAHNDVVNMFLHGIEKAKTLAELQGGQAATKAAIDANQNDDDYNTIAEAFGKRKAALATKPRQTRAKKDDPISSGQQTGGAPDIEKEYEAWLKYATKQMNEAASVDVLESFFNSFVEDARDKIFPPDFVDLTDCYQANERRLTTD